MMTVKNMESPRTGNPVANQFVISDGETLTFQSYDSEIMNVNNSTKTMIIHEDWDYSNTTKKYLNRFLADFCALSIISIKEIKSMVNLMNEAGDDEQTFIINGDVWTVKKTF